MRAKIAGIQKHHCHAPTCEAADSTIRSSFTESSASEGLRRNRLSRIAVSVGWSADMSRPIVPIMYPQRMASRLAPIECEVFHTDILVASSVGGIQWVSNRAHGGNPLP